MKSALACVAFLAAVLPSTSELRGQAAGEPAAAPKRFVPAEHLPAERLAFLSVANGRRFGEKLAGTLIGRIATHPGWRQAFSGFRDFLEANAGIEEKLERAFAPVTELTGKSPRELARLFAGELAFALRRFGPAGLPEIAIAVELGDDEVRAGILEVIERLKSRWEESGGRLEVHRAEGIDATVWRTPAGPIFHALIGTHLVAASDAELWRSIAAAYTAEGEARPAKGRAAAELEAPLALAEREVLLEVDLAAAREILLAFAGNSPEGEIENALRISGAGALSSFGIALGFRDGGLESAAYLAMAGGAQGALQVLEAGFPALEEVDGALEQIPAAASQVEAGRLALGKLLRGADRLVRRSVPELAAALDGAFEQIEAASGISVEKDLFTLGDLSFYSFRVEPPAGGLFDDAIVLVRTEALGGYWSFATKLAAFLGAEPRAIQLDGGGEVAYLNFAGGLRAGEDFAERFGGVAGFPENAPAVFALASVFLGPGVLARLELAEGWTALSALPQALVRHRHHYAEGPRLAADAPMAALARERLQGASYAAVSRGGRSLLWAYNSLLSCANAFAAFLALVGIDLAPLPPAEAFLEHVKPGFVRLTLAPEGFGFRGHRVLESSNAASLGAAAVAAVAGATVVSLQRAQRSAYKVKCMSNLRGLHGFAYGMSLDHGFFPYDADGSLASLQSMVDDAPGELLPDYFICPEGDETPAETDDGEFVLDEETCSYETVPWKLRNTAKAMLFFDRQPYHGGGRNVVFTDGSVLWLSEEEFQERLEEERERFSPEKK
jgi:prepilin-type processing-associated H-X9-DG protein